MTRILAGLFAVAGSLEPVLLRLLTLTMGPPLIVAVLYWTTFPSRVDGIAVRSSDRISARRPDIGDIVGRGDDLQLECRKRAAELAVRLNDGLTGRPETKCRILVRAPYILAGDLSESELETHYRETIVPIERALSVSYFDRPPEEPVTILLFSGDRSYRTYAEQLDGRQRANYSGYYQRNDRRIVLNVATGDGTLAHELTHALAHSDFPNMPEWFDEGLASLHEQSEFSQDGHRLVGLSNWRMNYILHAIRLQKLNSIESLVEAGNVCPEREAIDYAQARYFCLYLQKKGLLGAYYRKFRGAIARDPTGLQTLRGLFEVETLDAVDRDFRDWVVKLAETHAGEDR